MLCLQCLALGTANYLPPHTGIDSIWGLMVLIWIAQSTSMLFIEDRAVLKQVDGASESASWYWGAWKTWNNPRLLGTSREGRRIPKMFRGSSSRTVFAAMRVGKLAIYWILTSYVQPIFLPGPFESLEAADFDQTRQTYLRRIILDHRSITARETLLRAVMAFFWAWGSYILIDVSHTTLSIIFVLIFRTDRPDEWPPIFGDIREAHSLRGFWGQFWHRLVVLPYGNYGKLVAERCFGFRPGSLLYKSVVAFAIFLFSGVMHAIVAWELGDSCGWHLDIWWFLLNFAASAAETALLPKSTQGHAVSGAFYSKNCAVLNGGSIRRCVGFLWVFFFFFWSVPKWQYPKIYCLLQGR